MIDITPGLDGYRVWLDGKLEADALTLDQAMLIRREGDRAHGRLTRILENPDAKGPRSHS